MTREEALVLITAMDDAQKLELLAFLQLLRARKVVGSPLSKEETNAMVADACNP